MVTEQPNSSTLLLFLHSMLLACAKALLDFAETWVISQIVLFPLLQNHIVKKSQVINSAYSNP